MRAHAEDCELTGDQHFRDNLLVFASFEIGAGMNGVLARPACRGKQRVQAIGVGSLVGVRDLCLATILSGFEMNSIGMRSKIRSAITLAPCSSSFGSGLESFFASFAPAEA
jgi:hypothetical protein